MYEGTDGDRGKGKRVADLDVGVGTRYYLVAYLKTLGSEDVGLFAVCVLNQRDERGTVGIVLDCLYDTLNVKLVALEVDDTILSSSITDIFLLELIVGL